MKILTKKQRQPIKLWNIVLDAFKGVATLLDDVILGKTFAKEATNLILSQDGRWKTRWGTLDYGSSTPSNIIDCGKFIKTDGSQELIAICANGKAYKSAVGSSWSEISGATFNTSAKVYSFEQVNGVLLISNGEDNLTRYNGSTLTRYTTLSAPTGLGGVRNGLTAGSNNNYYVVTALNEVGETVGSSEVNITTNKIRDSWVISSNEYITLSWSAVSGATRYQVYYGISSGELNLLADTYTTTTTYIDTSVAIVNPYARVPQEDSTGAPKFRWVTLSDNRIWGVTKDTVWWSGTGDYIGYFGATYGGGWESILQGTGENFSWIGHFRDGKGNNGVTALTRNLEGVGGVWQIALNTIQIGDYLIVIPVPTKLPGPTGTVAPRAVVNATDALFMPNALGLFALNNKANIQNILSTDEVSGNLRPSYRSLLNKEEMAGTWYDSKIIFTASEGGNGNDIMFGYDTELKEWFWKWTIGFRNFIQATDSTGVTRLLGVPNSGTKLVEISDTIQGDNGVAFYQSWISGLIPVSSDAQDFVLVKKALIELGRPRGTIYFEVIGVEKRRGITSLGSRQITDSVSNIDFTNGLWGEYLFGEDPAVPVVYSSASAKKMQKVSKVLNAIQFRVYSSSIDTEFTLLQIQASGVFKRTKPPRTWYD